MLALDPEFAIVHKDTGLARSAHLFIGDDKYKYVYEYKGRKQDGAEYDRDGAAIEVRSLAPTSCRDNIVPYVASCLKRLQLRLEEWNDSYRLSTTPVFYLDDESLTDPPDDLMEFGCKPDVSAYTLQPKSPIMCDPKVRFTGGHLHVSLGGLESDIQAQASVAIVYDYFIGLPLVAILGKRFADGEAERRQMYGQAGSFRYNQGKLNTTYEGNWKFEYRVPSGRLMLSPILLTWAMGIQRLFSGSKFYELAKELASKIPPSEIERVINEHDVDAAETLYPFIYKLHPQFQEQKEALSNRLSDGGGSTRNPYAYKTYVDVFVAANHAGLFWEDDVKHNWGLYSDYEPLHHAYWAIGVAMAGQVSPMVFPQYPVLEEHIPKEFISKDFVYTHPLEGGKFKMHGSAGWLL